MSTPTQRIICFSYTFPFFLSPFSDLRSFTFCYKSRTHFNKLIYSSSITNIYLWLITSGMPTVNLWHEWHLSTILRIDRGETKWHLRALMKIFVFLTNIMNWFNTSLFIRYFSHLDRILGYVNYYYVLIFNGILNREFKKCKMENEASEETNIF